MRERGLDAAAQEVIEKYKRRFCDLSLYVKEVKERFTLWYNLKHQRVGTLWSGRFKSVLVDNGEALRTMARKSRARKAVDCAGIPLNVFNQKTYTR